MPRECVVVDRELRIADATDEWYRMTGVRADDVLGKSILEVLGENPEFPGHAEVRDRLVVLLEEAFTSGEVTGAGELLRYDLASTAGFTPRFWSTRNVPVTGASGDVEFVMHMTEDVSDLLEILGPDRLESAIRQVGADHSGEETTTGYSVLRHLYEALATSESTFRLAMHSSPIGMVIATLELKILDANQALCDMLGYTLDELLTLQVSDFSHAEDMAEDLVKAERLLSGEVPSYSMLKRYYRKDGSLIWAQLHVTLVRDASGAPLFAIGQVLDVSAQRRLVQELTRSNEDLKQFVSIASHDLQAPLRTIGGFAEVLTRSLDSQALSAEQREYLALINEGVSHMHTLIRDLLTYSRMERKDPQRVSVTSTYALALQRISSQLAESGAVPQLRGDDQYVLADPVQFQQILVNVMLNAVVHRSPDRALELTTTVRRRDGGVDIEIRDNGIGIAPAYHTKIFEPFKKVSKGGGSGVGLAIVARAAELNDGTVTVESNGASGSTFRITLPASSQQTEADQQV